MEKFLPKVGDKLYLRQFTKSYYVDIVKHPYTVVAVTPSKVLVQACKLIAPKYDSKKHGGDRADLDGQRVFFYDTVAERIEEDPNGRIEELTWHGRRGMWGTPGRDADYPEYAIFGEWKHQPYLD